MKKTLDRLTLLIVSVSVFAFLAASCGGSESGGSTVGGAVAKAEKIMQEEIAAGAPDFSCPPVEDSGLKVEGLPEEVTWLTSYPKDISSKATKAGGIFHQAIGEYPTTYRTIGPESNLSTRSYFLQLASLVGTSDETREFFPYAATHWAFGADNQTVYFKLNEHVKWSDGKPCTADDYVYMWKDFMLSPNLQAPWYNNYYKKLEVKKISDYCISVKYLESAKMDKATLLDTVNIAPRAKHFFGEVKENWFQDFNWKAEPVTGPYVFDENASVKGELLVFKRVENWWAREYPFFEKQYNIGRIELKVITGGADVTEGYFYKGELDYFPLNIPSLWRKAGTNENVTNGYIDRWNVHSVPVQGLYGIYFNTKTPFFSDRRVRQAMYYAIDIQGMIDQALYGEYSRYHNIGIGHFWGGVYFDDDSIRKPDFDPDKAKELLAEAGYTEIGSDGILMNKAGKRASFEVLYSAANHTERLTVLKEQAKKAGVEIELKLQASGAFNEVLNRKFQAWWGGLSTSTPTQYWQLFSKENAEKPVTNNFFGWWSPEMEKLLAIEQEGPSLEELARVHKEIQRIVHDEALIIPSYYLDYARCGAWKWVRYPSWGTQKFYDQTDWLYPIKFGWMWIDEDIKNEVLDAMKNNKSYEPRVWNLSERYKVK
ncbi:extracellular solute-binding protein [Treponema pedis]|uniref:ABC transporter substrate-binding protein n=1 Tax=Treponema pedis TaxID=409322 RepID=A0A7S7AWF6_9SPIR|nr:extracellular solute-binding protein [Treponema pedis]QOW60576.1 ABC transporter substrate-binding protein [Treponema pedis]